MKEIIVISSPEYLKGEAGIINELFDAGLLIFHLRKPEGSPGELNELLAGIKKEYRDRIVLPAQLLNTPVFEEGGFKRVHFFEHLRQATVMDAFEKPWEQGLVLSTSIHDGVAYDALPDVFDYTFFSPVFDSISKQGYKAMDRHELAVLEQKQKTKIIALGGINEHNCLQTLDDGFDGIALLGSIWGNEDPVDAFRRILKKVHVYESQ